MVISSIFLFCRMFIITIIVTIDILHLNSMIIKVYLFQLCFYYVYCSNNVNENKSYRYYK